MVKQKKKPIKKILKTKELNNIFKDEDYNYNNYNHYSYYGYNDFGFLCTFTDIIVFALLFVLLIAFLPFLIIFLLICFIFFVINHIVNGIRPYKNMEEYYD